MSRTQQEQAEELLRQFADAPIGLCYFDADLRFTYINKWLADINGVSPELHLGRTVDEVLEDLAPAVVPQLRRVLETGIPVIDGEVEGETQATGGKPRIFRHSYHPSFDPDGKIVGVSCVVQDVTELRAAQEEHDSLQTLQTVHERLQDVVSRLTSSPNET